MSHFTITTIGLPHKKHIDIGLKMTIRLGQSIAHFNDIFIGY